MAIPEVLGGYSKALYSTWLHYRPDHFLVDCGEGAATALGNRCFALEHVLLTHGHIDHVSGLPALLWARAGGMGDNQKPLQIFFPRDDGYVADMREYLAKTGERLPFELQWTPLESGETVDLGRGRSLETFPTQHMRESQSLGYKIIEVRKRLKPEFSDLGEAKLREMAQSGEIEAATQEYRAVRIAFGGDSLPIAAQHVAGSEILVHEATILNRRDRKGHAHSTLDEALEVAQNAQPGTLILNHFSSRYTRAEIETAIRHSAQKREIGFPIWILLNDKLRPVWIPAEQP